MKKPNFAQTLIDVRKSQGLTQEDVAQKCKINVRTIQRIESEIVKPRAFTIKVISETLGFEFFDSPDTNDGLTRSKTFTTKLGYQLIAIIVLVIIVSLISISTYKLNTNSRNQNIAEKNSIVGKWQLVNALVDGNKDPFTRNTRIQEYKSNQTYDASFIDLNGELVILYMGKYYMVNDSTIVAIRCNQEGILNNLASVYNVKVTNDTLHLYGYAIKTFDGNNIASFYLDEYWTRVAENESNPQEDNRDKIGLAK